MELVLRKQHRQEYILIGGERLTQNVGNKILKKNKILMNIRENWDN